MSLMTMRLPTSMPCAGELIDFGEERRRIDDDAVADDARDAGMQDAGRNQPQHELPAVDVHGVAGVVSALIAGDDRKARREQIDDLAFAFIAPLRTEDCEIHIGLRFYFVTADRSDRTAARIL